jgi:hypothetical protein
MRPRLFFLAVTLFWLAMNYLLWRSQTAGQSVFGSALPAEAVWDKILTAPDNSPLDIYDHEVKTGAGRWTAGLADSPLLSSQILAEAYQPGSPGQKLTGYTLSFEGSLLYKSNNDVRFQIAFALDTNKVWQDFRFHAAMRPRTWDVHALAGSEKVILKITEGQTAWDKTWTFAELRDPQTLFGEVGGPFALGVLGLNQSLPGVSRQGIEWDAHEDHIRLGGVSVRAYRLDTFILGQRVEIFVSRVGEILRVDLPRKISLRNQALRPASNG